MPLGSNKYKIIISTNYWNKKNRVYEAKVPKTIMVLKKGGFMGIVLVFQKKGGLPLSLKPIVFYCFAHALFTNFINQFIGK